jgi:antitoxin (DNA-binding transcriptional repressor) of toxin-antitoxin stability system
LLTARAKQGQVERIEGDLPKESLDEVSFMSHNHLMRAVNIKEAKARLNELIDAATAGEQVVLMRGSKHVAAIVPITADDLELATPLTDAMAGRLWQRLSEERSGGKTRIFPDAAAAVGQLAADSPAAMAMETRPRYGAARARAAKKAPSSKKTDR